MEISLMLFVEKMSINRKGRAGKRHSNFNHNRQLNISEVFSRK